MSLDCPSCGDAGDLRVIETRSTATRIFRTRRCKACGAQVVTCEGILQDGFIPRAIRKPAACAGAGGINLGAQND